MALSKVDYNSLNVTAAASKALKWNSSADGFETGALTVSLVLLETQTASSSATLSFTSGIDSTYKEYLFTFINLHPSANAYTQFQGTTDGSNYNTAITSTVFSGYHDEANSFAILQYFTSEDQAQGTGFQTLGIYSGADNDQNTAGYLHLFNPSNTTFVKHFIARIASIQSNNYSFDTYIAGYFNTTSAIDEIQFKFASGEIQAGTISLYGIK